MIRSRTDTLRTDTIRSDTLRSRTDTKPNAHGLPPLGQSAQAHAFPTSLRVRELMTRTLITVAPHTLAVHAERIAKAHSVHHLPVVADGRLQGVVCLCDLWRADSNAVAAELMTAPPVTIDSLSPAGEAADAMRDLAVGCLPVVDGEELVGILTRGDLRRHGLLDLEDLMRKCAACGTRHHSRSEQDAVVAFCLDCTDRGRAFDFDDPFDELGGET